MKKFDSALYPGYNILKMPLDYSCKNRMRIRNGQVGVLKLLTEMGVGQIRTLNMFKSERTGTKTHTVQGIMQRLIMSTQWLVSV